jgi:hypothetical protein
MGKKKNEERIWMRKHEEKRPLERHVYRWDNIKLNLGNGMGWCGLG